MTAKAKATTIATPITRGTFSRPQEQKRRREHEAQQNGEGEREKHLARNIKPGNDDGRDYQALKRRGPPF